jgi:hypothetical protein
MGENSLLERVTSAAIVRPFSYSQPDRLNPNHSPLHTTAITPRTTQ